MEASKVLCLPLKRRGSSETLAKIVCLSQDFRHFCHVRISRSPACQSKKRHNLSSNREGKVLQLLPETRRQQKTIETTLCSFHVILSASLGTSKFATSKLMFRVWFPPIFISCHKMPCLPRNLHFVVTSCRPDIAIRPRKRATRRPSSAANYTK